MVQEAVDLAKKRKVDMIARQEKRVAQLESLRALVRKKEEEVSCLSAAAIRPCPDNRLPSFAICSRPRGLIKRLGISKCWVVYHSLYHSFQTAPFEF